jgi:hypothetical protein
LRRPDQRETQGMFHDFTVGNKQLT